MADNDALLKERCSDANRTVGSRPICGSTVGLD